MSEIPRIFGAAASIDRWDGDGWVPHSRLRLCQDHWFCTGEPVGFDEPFGVEDIAVSVREGSHGSPGRFTVAGLESGWYRVSQEANEGDVAAGLLHITDDAPPPAPLLQADQEALSIRPVLLSEAGGDIGVGRILHGADGFGPFRPEFAAVTRIEKAFLERWNGIEWERVGQTALHPPREGSGAVALAHIPPLTQGAYQLVREVGGAGAVGQLFIDASLD